MLIKTQALYFDGRTSVPQNVELILDDAEKKLSFTKTDGSAVSDNLSEVDCETFNGRMKIKFKNEEVPVIVDEQTFIDEINLRTQNSIYKKLLNLKFGTYLLLAFVAFSSIIAAYILTTPIIAKKAIALIPVSLDVKMGDLFAEKYLKTVEIDSAKTALLNDFKDKITWNNKTELKIVAVKSDIVNAFALPNGNIIIFTGLLDKISDYELLAALLGHEASHVNKRHSMQIICKNLAGYALVSILTTNISGLTAVIIENADKLGTLSYSRDMETEADNQGIILLEENKINPDAMLRLMELLQSEVPQSSLDFLSTHPIMEKRIKNAKDKAKEEKHEKNAELERVFGKLNER